ncbi:MAG: tryptophan--tRNA ligase [Patescibacteria group bacterium]
MIDFLTGIRPTNALHIGNYFGALKPFVEFQSKASGIIMIVDYHAMDTETHPEALRQNILLLTATYLAVGVDVEKNILFQQSRVPEHPELAWIFSTLMRMSELSRMTQYKDKAVARGENVPVALFSYPLLMAADILLYDAKSVPVGEDQVQHVEFARNAGERFNKTYGDTFHIPKVEITKTGARVMALDNPEKKMSKSAASNKGYISLLDAPEMVQKKVMAAVTDAKGTVGYGDDQPGIKNLLDILSLASGKSIETLVASYTGKGYGDLKRDVAEAVNVMLTPIQARMKTYLDDPAELNIILDRGALRAQEIAREKMESVRRKIGVTI